MRTEAVVFTGVGEAAIGTVDIPDPGEHEVQIQTEWSFISTGTERWCLLDRFTWVPTPYPCVPGYQRVGRVVRTGSAVTDFKPGDRVFATTGSWSGHPAPSWGAHIRIANTHMNEVYALPEGVTLTNASGAVVAQVGSNAAARLTLSTGDWVVVYGEGLIGQSAAQGARALGARTILVGRHADKLELGARHSADHAVNNREQSAAERILALTGGERVAAVIDTIQSEAAQAEYMPLLRRTPYGQIVYAGFTPGTVWADMAALQQAEATCHFVTGWSRERIERTLNGMAAKELDLDPLITHRIPYREAPDMYRTIVENRVPLLGICIHWEEA